MLTTRTVSRVSSSSCLTDNCQEFNIRGNSLDISSSEASTSYNLSSQQHQHGFRCNQPKVTNHHSSSPDQSESVSCPSNLNPKLNKVHKMLLLCNHAASCKEEPCTTSEHCLKTKRILQHVLRCSGLNCKENCASTRKLLMHFGACTNDKCDTCAPVRESLRSFSRKNPRFNGDAGLKRVMSHQNNLMHVNCSSSNDWTGVGMINNESRVVSVSSTEQKDESVKSRDESVINAFREPNVLKGSVCSVNGTGKVLRNENGVKMEIFVNEPAEKSRDCSVKKVEMTKDENVEIIDLDVEEHKGLGDDSVEKKDGSVNVSVKESVKQNARGASLLDSFTPEEIKTHLMSLRETDTKVVSKKTLKEESEPDQNTCSLCKTGELLFAPPRRYCIKCAVQIASHGVYYSTDHSCTGTGTGTGTGTESVPVSVSLCSRCYNSSWEFVKLKMKDMMKSSFKKQMNYAETDADSEWWVQCSKCESWQHQVCALFNGKRKEANAEYTCVNCFLKEVESGEPKTLTLDPVRVLGAQDLPKTKLSDHVEKWLLEKLEIERGERASNLMKDVQEVPGVKGLFVRVVSCVDRVANVQPHFRDFMKKENYPSKFPYKSKAILLFQKIEGADVCLFAMYVQEYGSKCALPNQRHVYISYIDSVKYFQPEIRSASGEALRTFVYHQLLIGYLDYCKKKGFTSCSIWACPPTKHDDYILYCHPTTQKMPKAEKLRSWCYSEEEELPDREKHPAGLKHNHTFHKITDPSIPATTSDPDPPIHCPFFESRIDLLHLCQTNTYQFDSLRRAKHSTMMILYQLHTPACARCHAQSEADMWRCGVCLGFWVCEGCFGREGGEHCHEMVRGNGCFWDKEYFFPKQLMEGLVHASECEEPKCPRKICRELRLLFRHGSRCKEMHKRMWLMLIHHSRICSNTVDCKVPRCRDIKNHERERQANQLRRNR